MDTTLLKLIIDCTNENGDLDTAKLKSTYRGNLALGLRSLAQKGYISLLDADNEICEIEINPKAYRLFNK